MDFELDSDQAAVMEAVERLLVEQAGAARAIALGGAGEYDNQLHAALADAGFLDVAAGGGMGLLEAALVTEAAARAGAVVSAGACALVAAPTTDLSTEGALAITEVGSLTVPIRFLGVARTLLVVAPDSVRAIEIEPGAVEPVPSNFGYPMGRLTGAPPAGETLPGASAERVADLWRLSLAVEAVGTMEASLNETVDYLKQRRQFGRTIGSFQAVQHRLAECAIHIEGARWLAREAAHRGAPSEGVAAAASFAIAAAERVFGETHQLSGAIGFTREHDLHVWSMRLQALRLEMGGVRGHRRALAEARWTASPA